MFLASVETLSKYKSTQAMQNLTKSLILAKALLGWLGKVSHGVIVQVALK